MRKRIPLLAAALAVTAPWALESPEALRSASGGALSAEQAAYDVLSYQLELEIDPDRRTIEGSLTMEALVVRPLRWLVLDLDHPLKVSAATWLAGADRPLDFRRTREQVWIEFPATRPPGETIRVRVDYGGRPREAPRPPWRGGFVWSKTASGQPWAAVACQLEGADLWWPNKDHPSDKPERAILRFTVPKPLLAVSNGVLERVQETGDGRRTFHWRVDNPINPYNITVNIAPYRALKDTFESVAGAKVPMAFWVLPENAERGAELFRRFPRYLRFLEETLGPYPFRDEKFGVVEAPYLGMEHQTAIAYGNLYRGNDFGFDGLLLHEMAHEWWGNLVTARDWSDYWIHEGFATYMGCLFAERLAGGSALHRMTASLRTRLRNQDPLAPRESRTSVAKYFLAPEYEQADGDVNFKGALTLHTLRWLIGDEAFFESLRRFAYPDPPAAGESGSCRCRLVTTQDFIDTVEKVAGRDLDWFFEVYLRQPRLPRLRIERGSGNLKLEWETPNRLPFPMPIEVRVDGRTLRLETPAGRATLPTERPDQAVVDPDGWVLRR